MRYSLRKIHQVYTWLNHAPGSDIPLCRCCNFTAPKLLHRGCDFMPTGRPGVAEAPGTTVSRCAFAAIMIEVPGSWEPWWYYVILEFGNLPVSCSAVSMCTDVHMYIGSANMYIIYKRINWHFVSQTCLNAASFDSNGGLWNFGDVAGETETTVIVERLSTSVQPSEFRRRAKR